MYQAGIKNITLYENKGITFNHYDPLDYSQISNIEYEGSVIEITNNQLPSLDIELTLSDNGQPGLNYNLKFYLLGLILDNYDTLFQLKTSIYGWKMLIEFYDDTYRFYDAPIFCKNSKINPQFEMAYEIEMKNPVLSLAKYYEYTPGISTVGVYRADTTILTTDSTIYTADYAL